MVINDKESGQKQLFFPSLKQEAAKLRLKIDEDEEEEQAAAADEEQPQETPAAAPPKR